MLDEILNIYRQKKVLITGITGFKGSWMCQWLLNIGAKVYGLSLDPPTDPSMFKQLDLEKNSEWYNLDIRNFDNVKMVIGKVKPDIIFHLAAQSLVRASYENPLETFETNILGTINLFEAVRQSNLSTNIVIVTSDKCYENNEWTYGYRENDPLGGYDPYSASKGATEIIVSSYRRSFFNPANYENHGVNVCSARAGNVIGGGDWAIDRIVPDCIRFLLKDTPIIVRNPLATRPWQHVLEPVGGYLVLGTKLFTNSYVELEKFCSAFNFGPLVSSNKTVGALVNEILKHWGKGEFVYNKEESFHEAHLLSLSIDKAYSLLQWYPVWEFEETIKNTVLWYKELIEQPENILDLTNDQINKYSKEFRFVTKNF